MSSHRLCITIRSRHAQTVDDVATMDYWLTTRPLDVDTDTDADAADHAVQVVHLSKPPATANLLMDPTGYRRLFPYSRAPAPTNRLERACQSRMYTFAPGGMCFVDAELQAIIRNNVPYFCVHASGGVTPTTAGTPSLRLRTCQVGHGTSDECIDMVSSCVEIRLRPTADASASARLPLSRCNLPSPPRGATTTRAESASPRPWRLLRPGPFRPPPLAPSNGFHVVILTILSLLVWTCVRRPPRVVVDRSPRPSFRSLVAGGALVVVVVGTLVRPLVWDG